MDFLLNVVTKEALSSGMCIVIKNVSLNLLMAAFQHPNGPCLMTTCLATDGTAWMLVMIKPRTYNYHSVPVVM